jgi:hypothetical protein
MHAVAEDVMTAAALRISRADTQWCAAAAAAAPQPLPSSTLTSKAFAVSQTCLHV